jgi:DNA-binding GntR family transcriptional regulator
VVAPFDLALFDAIYQFRSAVEPLAARLATEQLTDADLARGRDLIAAGIKAAKAHGGAAVQADMAFHSWIYDLSGNSLVVDTMRLNWQHLRRAMGEVLRHPTLSKRVWDEHHAIVDAMAKRDAEAAALLIHRHVMKAHEDVRPRIVAGRSGEPTT